MSSDTKTAEPATAEKKVAVQQSNFHLKADVADLIKAIQQGGESAARGAHPIYESVRLEVNRERPGEICVESTDCEQFTRVRRFADSFEVLDDGALVIQKAQLLRILSDTKRGPCELRATARGADGPETNLLLLMEGSEFRIQGGWLDDFPSWPKLGKEPTTVEVAFDEFAEAVRLTSFAAAKERMRFALNGVQLELRPQVSGKKKTPTGEYKPRFVTTDGRRLSLYDVNARVEGFNDSITSVIIPTRTILAAAKWVPKNLKESSLLSEVTGVTIEMTMEYVRLAHGDYEVVNRCVEGAFPSVDEVVPRSTDHSALFDKADLETALIHADRCTARDATCVKIELRPEERRVRISSRNSEASFQRDLLAHIEGDAETFGFNPVFLLEGLKHFPGESVQIGLHKASPCLIRNGPWTYVVMPVTLE